jgi:PKD repeat protein
MSNKLNYCTVLFALMIVIKVNAAVPSAAFDINPSIGCALPHTVFFTDNSASNGSNISNWDWDFGDTNTSTLQNPVHNYTVAGDFTVSLTVTNVDGSDSTTDVVKVSVPTADIGGPAFGYFGCGPLDVNFVDSSSSLNSTPSSWFWEFGDGGTSTLQNPSYTYQTPGIYTTSLTVTDANGCVDTDTIINHTQVIGPNVSFTTNQISNQAPSDVDFTDTTIFGAPIVNWTWDFDDGNSSNIQNPSNTYTTQGEYNPTVTITDIDGCSRTADNGLLTVVADQIITFNDPADQIYSIGGTFNAPATSDSGLAVALTSNDLAICTVTGNTVNIVSSGTCSLTASQAGSSIYNPAIDVTQTVNITQADQIITFNDPVDQTFTVGGTFNAPATSDSGLVVTMVSNNTIVCTISGFTTTMVSPGTCSLTASQAGDTNFNAATDVTQLININAADTDGVNDLIENAVPNADGLGFGDGDGNGVLDSTESNVASFIANNGTDYFTVKSSFPLSNLNVSIEQLTGLTEEVNFPYDFLGFTLNGLSAGESVTVEIFVPHNASINSYWKQGNDSLWSNMATGITRIGTTKTKITLQLTEGGNFDSDSDATTLTDPGAAGTITYMIPINSIWLLIILALLLSSFSYLYLFNANKKI